jgi:hypothetical protein
METTDNQSEPGHIPHCAVIFVKAEVMQRLPNGKVSNQPLSIIPELFMVEHTDQASSQAFAEAFIKGLRDYGKTISERLKQSNGQAIAQQAD